MKVLVTGGAGFIGSHLVRKLIFTGYEVTVLDNLSTGSLDHLPQSGFSFWKDDIRNKSIRSKIISEHFDAIVHLAAQTMVNSSISNPFFDMEENIVGLVNILEAARYGDIHRIVFSSTAAVYGDVKEDCLPIHEDAKLNPMSFYGLSKVTSEKYLDMYHRLYDLNYIILRFSNVYGERQGDKGEGGVISIFSKQINKNKSIKIFGNGNQTRDFIYAGDIASGICCALSTKYINDIYNLSTGKEISLNGLLNYLKDIAKVSINIEYEKEREGDIQRSVLSNDKAQKYLKWRPVTSLFCGLQKTMNERN
jgi:UDP-glucose 4-epimerase